MIDLFHQYSIALTNEGADGLIVLITSTYRGLSLTNVLEISRLP